MLLRLHASLALECSHARPTELSVAPRCTGGRSGVGGTGVGVGIGVRVGLGPGVRVGIRIISRGVTVTDGVITANWLTVLVGSTVIGNRVGSLVTIRSTGQNKATNQSTAAVIPHSARWMFHP